MAKTEVYLIAKKRNVKVDARLAPALVKMGRATYPTENMEEGSYEDKMMRSPASSAPRRAGLFGALLKGKNVETEEPPKVDNPPSEVDKAAEKVNTETKNETPAEEKTE